MNRAELAHVALIFSDVDTNVKLFCDLFNMKITEEKDGMVWLSGGIQLIPMSTNSNKSWPDHLAFKVDSPEDVLRRAKSLGCELLKEKENWIKLPEGLVIEVLRKTNERKEK